MNNLRSFESKAKLQSFMEKSYVVVLTNNKYKLYYYGEYCKAMNEKELYLWEFANGKKDPEFACSYVKHAYELRKDFNKLSLEDQCKINNHIF